MRVAPFLLLPWFLLSPLAAQERDAAFERSYSAWEEAWRAHVEVLGQARREGRLPKGALLPEDLQAAQDVVDGLRDRLLERFGDHEGLSASSLLKLARLHERSRSYAAAVTTYEHALRHGDPDAPDVTVLHAICIAAMNSKDDALAARWMRRTIEREDELPPSRRNLSVRTTYYPRTLIALEEWNELERHLARLLESEDERSQRAARQFLVVAAIHRGDLEDAESRVQALRADPKAFADLQAWAVLAEFALLVGRSEFERGAEVVRDYLEGIDEDSLSAVARNHVRYLRAVEPFLGRPAPPLRFDECVGGNLVGEDVLSSLRGRVLVLDFWQPWCEPCRKAMPKLIALQREFEEGLLVLGVCKVESYGYDVSEKRAVRPIEPEDYRAHVEDFQRDMGIVYPLGIAREPVNDRAYAIAGVPTLVVIDRGGIVRYMSCGAGEPGLLELAVRGVAK